MQAVSKTRIHSAIAFAIGRTLSAGIGDPDASQTPRLTTCDVGPRSRDHAAFSFYCSTLQFHLAFPVISSI